MPPVKPLQRSSEKWVRASQAAQPEYVAGVQAPRASWAQRAAAAKDNWDRAVTQAVQEDRFRTGIARAGDEKWRTNTLQKGPGRWSEGIRLARDNWSRGFAPFRQVLENLTLPARGPKGDPNNINRVAAVAKALHDAKLSQGS